ncbi:hypothetical protein, partial [Chryseobacterium sp. SIMBA_028]
MREDLKKNCIKGSELFIVISYSLSSTSRYLNFEKEKSIIIIKRRKNGINKKLAMIHKKAIIVMHDKRQMIKM